MAKCPLCAKEIEENDGSMRHHWHLHSLEDAWYKWDRGLPPTTDANTRLLSPAVNTRRQTPQRTGSRSIRLHFIRHGQAAHNLKHLKKYDTWSIYNPPLSPLGHAQCKSVRENFPYMDSITHVLCSPLTRTVQTAFKCFGPVYTRGIKVIAWDRLMEFGVGPCNTRDSLSQLKRMWKGQPIELGLVGDRGPSNDHRHIAQATRRHTANEILGTLSRFCKTVAKAAPDGGDINILVVTHGGLLWEVAGDRFKNCQFKSYEFSPYEERLNSLTEIDESRARAHVAITKLPRAKPVPPPSETEQEKPVEETHESKETPDVAPDLAPKPEPGSACSEEKREIPVIETGPIADGGNGRSPKRIKYTLPSRGTESAAGTADGSVKSGPEDLAGSSTGVGEGSTLATTAGVPGCGDTPKGRCCETTCDVVQEPPVGTIDQLE